MKLIHLLSAVVFLGNLIAAIFWKLWAEASADPRIMARTCRGLIRADRLLSLPAMGVLVIAGFGAAGIGGWAILRTGWILWSLAFFAVLSLTSMGGVSPAQKKMAPMTAEAASSGILDDRRYASLSRSWNL